MAPEKEPDLTQTLANPAALPARVGKYRVTGKLGQGGMGVVLRAVDEDLGRTVALKFIPPGMHRAGAEERFLREARAASALDHVNIGTIFGIEETDDGRRFITMAYYEGESLAERLRDGVCPVAPAEAIGIAVQAARGLAAAHARGIVHRDIKPSNIMLTADGVVKIVDFGLASMAGADELTRTGAIAGTPAYMSPEQALGKAADARSDVWALGIVLLEMLTGERVFQADGAAQALYQVVHGEIPALRAVGQPLRSVLEKVVERDRAKRYRTMSEFLTALEAVSAAAIVGRQLPPVRPERRWAIMAIVAALLLGGAVSIWRLEQPGIPGAPSSKSVYDKYLQGLNLLKRWDKAGNLARAAALFTEATKSEPKFALGFAGLAESQRIGYALSRDKSLLTAAAANAEKAMSLDPNLTRVQVAWGRIQSTEGQNDLAMSSFAAALKIDPNNADAHSALARQYERMQRFDDSEAEHMKATTLDPDSMFFHDAYGNFLYNRSRYADAAREWREVLRIAPDNAAAYVNLGAALNETGDTAGAIGMYLEAMKLKPDNVAYTTYANLGSDYYHEGRYRQALDALQEAIRLNPKRALAWENLGYARSEMPGMLSAANEAFARAIELGEQDRKDSPSDPEVDARLARCYAKMGKAALAMQRLETALALSPNGPDIQAQAAEVYELLGRRDKAVEYAKTALKLGYPKLRLEKNPELKNVLPDLK